MPVTHFLVYSGGGQYKLRCNRASILDEKTITLKDVTCSNCIENMHPEEDLMYRQSKVSYGELEDIVRRVSDAYNGVDNIFEVGRLADELIKKLPGHSRKFVEENK